MHQIAREVAPSQPSLLSPGSLALVQGLYFSATGIWPLLHMSSFEAVTGPKVDRWLVRTVGALIGVIGGVLVLAGRNGRTSPEIRVLAAGSAAALAAVDLTYVARKRISPVYLLDAAAELGLLAGWAAAGAGRSVDEPSVRKPGTREPGGRTTTGS